MKRKNLGFDIFIYSIGIVLASTTFLFGYTYLTIAGIDTIGKIVGALYALLLGDIAFWVWRSALHNDELTPRQRQWAGLLTICGFGLSLTFTLGHLALTTGLRDYVDVSAIDAGVYWVLIALTAVNALGVWRFQTNSTQNVLRSEIAESKADIIDDSITQAKQLLSQDKDALVTILSGQMRQSMLAQIGFTGNLKPIGNDVTVIEGHQQDDNKTAVPANSNQLPSKPKSSRYQLIVNDIPMAHGDEFESMKKSMGAIMETGVRGAYILDTITNERTVATDPKALTPSVNGSVKN